MPKPPAPPRRPGSLPPRRSIDELLAEGLRLHQMGRAADAAPLYRQVLDRMPDQPAANHLLGLVNLQQGKPEEAVRLISRAIRARGTDPQYFANLGVALNQLGRHAEAVDALDRALALNPRLAGALSNRGMAQKALGRHDAAAQSYRAAIALLPNEPGFHANLGNTLVEAGDLQAAETAFRDTLQLRPWHTPAIVGLCMVFEETNRVGEAEALARRAADAVPAEPQFHYRLGRALGLLRRPDQAAAAFRAAVRLKPDYGLAWCYLAETVRRDYDDDELAAIRLLTQTPGIAPDERAFAGFALGRSLADLDRHEESIAAFKSANALRRQSSQESPEAEIALLRHRLAQFSAWPAPADGAGFHDIAPVFVVGLPRSGKTTVESMLAASDLYTGVGEQRIMPRLVSQAIAAHGEDLAIWPAAAWTALGAGYAEQVTPLLPSGRHPVDTLPPNFALVGFILAALPRARIVHTIRNRSDHLIALFEKDITGSGYAYTTALPDLLAYHAAYRDLMAAWHRLRPDAVADLDITDSAAKSRVLGHLGLPAALETTVPESEPRAGNWPEDRIAANRRRHLAAWQSAHPELFGTPGDTAW
jgi:tetratricopeptide (TPR) repeat protein